MEFQNTASLPRISLSNSRKQEGIQGDSSFLRNTTLLVEDVPSELPELQKAYRRRPSQALWRLTLLVGDAFVIVMALTFALFFIIPAQPALVESWISRKFGNLELIWGCLGLASWCMALSITQAQDFIFVTNRFKSALAITLALLLTVTTWTALTWLGLNKVLAPAIKAECVFLVWALPLFVVWRVALAFCMSLPQFAPRAVIVGVNAAGSTLVKELKETKRPNISVLGYISEKPEIAAQVDGLPVLGSRIALRNLIERGLIDTIIMTLDYKVNPSLFQETIEAAQRGISVVPMSLVYEQMSGKIAVEHIGDQWYGSLPSEVLVSPFYLCWRKLLDLTFGLVGTTIMLLLLPLIALCIYLDSPGPIFYKQQRIGYRGKPFNILKFRSMRTDAEKVGNAIWAVQGDRRVTRVGRLMRATHFDELPQVINILRGEMTLVGPRPERQVFVEHLSRSIPFYHCRLSVRPGLTGWAQVKYPYASSDYDAFIKLQYDLYYIKHQSMMLDIFIILKTVIEVLFCRGR